MSNSLTHVSKQLALSAALVVLVGSVGACLTDKDKDDEGSAGSGGSGQSAAGSSQTAAGTTSSAGKTATAGSGSGGSTSATGTACASSIVLAAAKPGIATFDDYEDGAALSTWSFALGSDSSTGVFAGPFGYGDRESGKPETFAMIEGYDSTYALSISDTMALEYGGGMGIWLSSCLDVKAFSGVSFWVRGNAPTGTTKFTLLMEESTAVTPAMPTSKVGTCPGTDKECIHPTYDAPVTDTWTEIKIPWAEFKPGSANGEPVIPDGHNVWQLQFDVGLSWEPDAACVYAPIPGPYELAVEGVSFY